MPADRPLREVLREVEDMLVYLGNGGDDPLDAKECANIKRLASELRAVAPLLRDAALELSRHLHPQDHVMLDELNAKADELEAR